MSSPPAAAGVVTSLSFHEVLLRWAPDYLQRHGAAMPDRQRHVLEKILRCHTPALGGSLYQCQSCGTVHFTYHSCNDRHCPLCGHNEAQQWLEQHNQLLLPVPYFMVTFTLPDPLRAWIRSNPELGYQLLFSTTARALQDLAANPKRLGGELGLMGFLHTWSRTLIFHPHIHYLLPGGALDHRQWVTKGSKFFVSRYPLADHFRTLFQQALRRKAPQALVGLPAIVWRQRWSVKVNAMGSGHQALEYLSRYVFKTATGNRRLLQLPDGRLRWPFRNSRTGRPGHVHLQPEELIRRFLQHVLPAGFHRLRLFGWYHPAGRLKLNRVRALLNRAPHLTQAEQQTWQLPEELITPAHELENSPPVPLCPRCHQPMELYASWLPGQPTPLPPTRAPPPVPP